MASSIGIDDATPNEADFPPENQNSLEILSLLRSIQVEMRSQKLEIANLQVANRRSSQDSTEDIYEEALHSLYSNKKPPAATFTNFSGDRAAFNNRNYSDRDRAKRYSDQHYDNGNINNIPFRNNADRQTFLQASTDPAEATWFSKKMDTIIPSANTFTSITKSIIPIDPKTSQCCLKHLTFPSFYYFMNQFMLEQQNHPDEHLQMGRFIKFPIVMQLQAFDSQLGLSGGKFAVVNETIKLDNPQLYHVIYKFVAPKSTEEFITNLTSLAKFAQPPSNYIVDPANFQWIYENYLMFFHTFIEVFKIMTSNPDSNFCPLLKSKNGRIGLLEIINEAPPFNIGLSMASMLNPHAVKNVEDIYEYIDMLKRLSQHLQDQSLKASLDKVHFFQYKKKGTPVYNAPITPSSSNNPSTSHNNNNNNNYNNFRNNSSTPFSNPHVNAMNNNYNIYKTSDNYDSRKTNFDNDIRAYNSSTDENVNEFDYFDPHVDKYNSHTPPDVDMYAINGSTSSNLPCFEMFKTGKCNISDCPYMHDKKRLSEEWVNRQQSLNKSPYNPNTNTNTNPTSILRNPNPNPNFASPLKTPQSTSRFPTTTSSTPSAYNKSMSSSPVIQFGDFEYENIYEDNSSIPLTPNPMSTPDEN